VVIAIISLLSSVIMVSVQDSRNKARVAKVKSDFVQIRNAAELYKSDTGNYPTQFTDLVPKYIARTPRDPFAPVAIFSPINTAYALTGGAIGGGTIGGGAIVVPDGSLYSIGTETAATFCGATNNQSEFENGKFVIYSQGNVGLKNISFFTKFKVVQPATPCFSGPCLNVIYNTAATGVIPCLD